MDKLSAKKRSEIMSKVPQRDSKQEISVRKFLFSHGFRFRKNDKRFPGSPDIVLPKYKTIVFVHGCFWHGHQGCRAAKLPSTRSDFWRAKIERNIERDNRKVAELENLGWKVITVWQCELKNKDLQQDRLNRLIKEIEY
ncbi:MAG: DNA mismatch endonuclease Vsr [Bacteroidota bacterium]